MKLLIKEIKRKLPRLYETESIPENEKISIFKFFKPHPFYLLIAQ